MSCCGCGCAAILQPATLPDPCSSGLGVGQQVQLPDGTLWELVFDPLGACGRAWVMLVTGSAGGGSVTIFMAPTTATPPGNDANPGTAARPVLTLARALELAGEQTGIGTVYISAAAGTYPTLTPASAAPDASTVFQVSPRLAGSPTDHAHLGPATIHLVGALATVATVTATAVDVGDQGFDTGVPVVADLYLGALAQVTSSTNPDIVGWVGEVYEAQATGHIRLSASLAALGGLPVGTTFALLRPSAVFPVAGGPAWPGPDGAAVVFAMQGGEFQMDGVKWAATGADPIRFVVGGGTLSLGVGTEVDLADVAEIELADGGILALEGRYQIPPRLATIGTTPTTSLVNAGAYVHRTTYADGRGIVAARVSGADAGASGAAVRAGPAVLADLAVAGPRFGFAGRRVEYVRATVALWQGAKLHVDGSGGGKSRDAPLDAFAVSEGATAEVSVVEVAGFLANALVASGNATLGAVGVTGAGAVGSGFGIVLAEASHATVVESTVAGAEPAGAGEMLVGLRPVTYAELAAAGIRGITDGIQAGTATLAAGGPGAQATVAAYIRPGAFGESMITFSRRDLGVGAPGNLYAPAGLRIAGSPAPDGVPATGTFEIDSDSGGDDGASVDWTIVNEQFETLCRVVGA